MLWSVPIGARAEFDLEQKRRRRMKHISHTTCGQIPVWSEGSAQPHQSRCPSVWGLVVYGLPSFTTRTRHFENRFKPFNLIYTRSTQALNGYELQSAQTCHAGPHMGCGLRLVEEGCKGFEKPGLRSIRWVVFVKVGAPRRHLLHTVRGNKIQKLRERVWLPVEHEPSSSSPSQHVQPTNGRSSSRRPRSSSPSAKKQQPSPKKQQPSPKKQQPIGARDAIQQLLEGARALGDRAPAAR